MLLRSSCLMLDKHFYSIFYERINVFVWNLCIL